ncbi:hyaluronoglucosaminidase [Tumebacillus sp. BK434]|uniref:protein O-GlcNAcase n=1 Tax=Tumebacillus sp. BK434 TaxID=2512169 RepID=UPI00104DE261|nr:protein O-GlcNAcase [Tumebacillus sp. BK434]TCP55488.1 hyaluronoglucosaminidase [Tumebacillus sp. BK434]
MKKTGWLVLAFLLLIVAAGWWAVRGENLWPTPQSHPAPAPAPAPNPTPEPGQQQPEPEQEPERQSEFAVRGVIEGFYGEPWTHAQRLEMLAFMGQHHFTTYVYAPKDDPYQRRQWGELYPPELGGQMRSLAETAKQNGIELVYSISPGIPAPLPSEQATPEWVANSITVSSPDDRQRLLAKIDQLRGYGVHDFMLSFDDVQEIVKPEDQAVYGSDYAKAHVDLANAVYRAERAKDPDFQLWFAPTDYYGLGDSGYWQTIRNSLDPAIPVIWTGEWVLNRAVTSEQADQVAKLLGRKPMLWDNYPVNDYTYAINKRPQLIMGPLENRSADLGEHLSGYLTNPQIQPEASKISLATIGDYLRDPHSYEAATAWKAAMHGPAGVQDEEALLLFSQYAAQSTLRPGGNPDFAKLAADYWQGGDPAALREEFQALAALPDRVRQGTANPELLLEISPWLTKLGEEGQAGLLAMQYLENPADRGESFRALLGQIKGNPLQIGGEIVEFLQQAAQR